MAHESLEVHREGPIVTVRLHRPERRNAINRRMHLELQAVCRELGDETSVRVVILSGAGPAFSAGADTTEWGEPEPTDPLEARRIHGLGARTTAALESLDQVTIAAVHGFAVGGAIVLALCCDLRVAGASTWFALPEVELGIPLSWHGLPRLVREVGPARALQLVVSGERLSAPEAERYGLVTHVVPDGTEEARARELAELIVARPALAVTLTKAAVRALKRTSELGQVAYSDPDLRAHAGRLRG